MIGAFGGALALAVAVLAGYGTGPDGLKLGLRVTARWSFLFSGFPMPPARWPSCSAQPLPG
ncbi:MAG: hypothetical protein WA415_18455 [Mycobacterium sp.]